ncbi:MAG: UDP-glucose 4-epimerase GalE [Nanoarchaeota archaeon]|mgnify:FL=1
MKVLVTGGAGYIGSHVVRFLVEKGHTPIVLDKSPFAQDIFSEIKNKIEVITGDLGDKNLLEDVFKNNQFDAVLHFAGSIEAGESMKNPSAFFHNNVTNGVHLLDTMVKYGVKKIIFSSSAAVYKTKNTQLTESDIILPENFYGETKLKFERLLYWYNRIHGINFVSLRYFNAGGAGYNLGENHTQETHLIPLILQTALGQRDCIKIFGSNYPTTDGTCVRDYIHVLDLANAHLLALENIRETPQTYNVGTGKGYSVREIINLAEDITGKKIFAVDVLAREGDAAYLVADPTKIEKEWGWKAEHDIKDIIESAWEFHKKDEKNLL